MMYSQQQQLQQQQQQIVPLNSKVGGRVCFLATNLINMMVYSLSFYKMTFESVISYPWALEALIAYFALHSLFGVICALDQDQHLLNSYKTSCYIMGTIQILTVIGSFFGAIYYANKDSFGSVLDSLLFLICCASLIGSVIETIIVYNNFKYINSLIASLSNQYFLGLSQPAHFTQQPQQVHQQQPQFSQQGYVLHYPQLHQQYPQLQGTIDLKQQSAVQPSTSDALSASMSTHKQPLILQNGYTQFQ